MFDILNEVQYIKDVLAKGFGKKWITDAGIYVRYCKLEGFSKEETKEKLKEKMEKYVVGYNEYKYYKITDNILKRYWKIEEPFREINQIDIPIKVLDWFYENNDLKIKEKKVLFTLYCWAQLQKQAGIEFYKYINLNRFMARFKKEANVSTSSSLRRNELNHLGYLGYLKMTEKNASYECRFLDISPFNIVDRDTEILNGKYLQNFGDFINDYMINKSNKIKYGTFKCKNCGKEFGHYNNSLQEKGRVYCKECADIIGNHKFDGDSKVITCQDCGKEILIDINDVKTCRCAECQKKYRNAYIAKKMRENYWLTTLEINKDNISVGIGEIDSNIKEKLEPVWGTFKDITEEDAKKIVILMKNTHKRDFTYKILEETEGKEEKTIRVISYS